MGHYQLLLLFSSTSVEPGFCENFLTTYPLSGIMYCNIFYNIFIQLHTLKEAVQPVLLLDPYIPFAAVFSYVNSRRPIIDTGNSKEKVSAIVPTNFSYNKKVQTETVKKIYVKQITLLRLQIWLKSTKKGKILCHAK